MVSILGIVIMVLGIDTLYVGTWTLRIWLQVSTSTPQCTAIKGLMVSTRWDLRCING